MRGRARLRMRFTLPHYRIFSFMCKSNFKNMATAEKLELAEQYVFKNFINEAVDTLKGIGRSL